MKKQTPSTVDWFFFNLRKRLMHPTQAAKVAKEETDPKQLELFV